jgi:hypothetical protein
MVFKTLGRTRRRCTNISSAHKDWTVFWELQFRVTGVKKGAKLSSSGSNLGGA